MALVNKFNCIKHCGSGEFLQFCFSNIPQYSVFCIHEVQLTCIKKIGQKFRRNGFC